MGTPFLRKQWIVKETNTIFKFVNRAFNLDNLQAIPIILLIFLYCFYIYSLGFSLVALYLTFLVSLVSDFQPWFPILSLNPLNWPKWYFLSSLVIAGFIYFWGLNKTKYNTNIYFDKKRLPSQITKFKKVPSLVLTAKYLDEALLGLSSEACIYANLVPQLKNLLVREFSSNADLTERIGETSSLVDDFKGPVRGLLSLLITPVLSVLMAIVEPFRLNVLLPWLTRFFIKVITSTAFGLPGYELDGSRIEVKSRLDIPDFFEEDYEDVTPLAFENSGKSADPAAVAEKNELYAHVRTGRKEEDPDTALDNKKNERKNKPGKNPWKNLSAKLDHIYDNIYVPSFKLDEDALAQANGESKSKMLSKPDFENYLARTLFTLEARTQEIDLVHSLYYSNDKTIERIANFIKDDL